MARKTEGKKAQRTLLSDTRLLTGSGYLQLEEGAAGVYQLQDWVEVPEKKGSANLVPAVQLVDCLTGEELLSAHAVIVKSLDRVGAGAGTYLWIRLRELVVDGRGKPKLYRYDVATLAEATASAVIERGSVPVDYAALPLATKGRGKARARSKSAKA